MNQEKLPNHIVIIPDANRRWARERGLSPWKGHEAGAENSERLMRYALKKGISCLSFWGSSLENLKKRPLLEKKALLSIYQKYFKKIIREKEIYDQEVKINVIGRWEKQFPSPLKKTIRTAMEKTRHHKKKLLNFFLAYSGVDEMLEAIKKISREHPDGKGITGETIKKNLMTKDLPPVDYLIRTGGEPHLSAGFMMWDLADAQLYFSEEKFPDFNEEKFEAALREFFRRQRRFGR